MSRQVQRRGGVTEHARHSQEHVLTGSGSLPSGAPPHPLAGLLPAAQQDRCVSLCRSCSADGYGLEVRAAPAVRMVHVICRANHGWSVLPFTCHAHAVTLGAVQEQLTECRGSITTRNSELVQLQEQLQVLQGRLDEVNASLATSQSEVHTYKNLANVRFSTIASLRAQLNESQAQHNSTKKTLEEVREELEGAHSQMGTLQGQV